MDNIENGRITDVFFGIEDHGCMTLMITIEGEHWGCGYGGYQLLSKEGGGMYAIKKLLETFEVYDIKKLEGKIVRVKWLNNSYSAGNKIVAIGDIIKNKWFDWDSAFAEFKEKYHENI